MKYALILMLPLMLAGCVTEDKQGLPMSLGPTDSAQTACLGYGNAPSYGDCSKALPSQAQ